MPDLDYPAMLQMALEEARQGRAEGGIPIGAALFHRQGQLLGRGHNRRVQKGSAILHGKDACKADGNAVTATRSW
jgi:cytosine deaminase